MIEVSPEVKELCLRIRERGYKRVILLGTPEQMEQPHIRKPLAACGILVLVPGEYDRRWIGELLTELEQGRCHTTRLKELRNLLQHGIEHGAEAIIIAAKPLASEIERLALSVPIITL